MTRHRRRLAHSDRHRRPVGPSVISLFALGLVAFSAAVLWPVVSLLGGSPATIVTATPGVDAAALARSAGGLVVAVAAAALGGLLAVAGSVRPRRYRGARRRR